MRLQCWAVNSYPAPAFCSPACTVAAVRRESKSTRQQQCDILHNSGPPTANTTGAIKNASKASRQSLSVFHTGSISYCEQLRTRPELRPWCLKNYCFLAIFVDRTPIPLTAARAAPLANKQHSNIRAATKAPKNRNGGGRRARLPECLAPQKRRRRPHGQATALPAETALRRDGAAAGAPAAGRVGSGARRDTKQQLRAASPPATTAAASTRRGRARPCGRSASATARRRSTAPSRRGAARGF